MAIGPVVAPFAGAWIEIDRERNVYILNSVAPFAGAWIEIYFEDLYDAVMPCRSLRGSVD